MSKVWEVGNTVLNTEKNVKSEVSQSLQSTDTLWICIDAFITCPKGDGDTHLLICSGLKGVKTSK